MVQNQSGIEAADANVRENGAKAREVKGKIYNATFLLQLAGVSTSTNYTNCQALIS